MCGIMGAWAWLVPLGCVPSVTLMHAKSVESLPVKLWEPRQEFVSLAFSPDSKLLMAQGGAPDWCLTVSASATLSKPLDIKVTVWLCQSEVGHVIIRSRAGILVEIDKI